MKNRFIHILVSIFLLLAFSQCSTKKNTRTSRAYHYVTARYNVHFNGKQAYEKGNAAIKEANIDNYAEILPLYPSSNAASLTVATADMDRVIEKCLKTIKLHSIVKKPKKNAKKRKDPKYIAFRKKEEYNPMVQQAWLLLGKAQLYKSEYLAAGATFAYISRHFKDDKELCTEAKLWSARAFAELAWYYEAEDVLNKLPEVAFSPRTTKLFVMVKADLLLKQEKYADAIPFLKTAIKNAIKEEKPRIAFILAQIFEELGNYSEAQQWYTFTVDNNAAHELAFNAMLNRASCYKGDDKKAILKSLYKLSKLPSNAVYLDQIYYAIGSLYLLNQEEDKAVENFELAIEKSTRKGEDMARVMLALGDIYYEKANYLGAQPLYHDAIQLLPLSYEGYEQLEEKSQALDLVASNLLNVQLQDSLQYLALLPKEEQIEQIKLIVKQERLAEEAEAVRLASVAQQETIREQNAAVSQMGLSLGEQGDKSWYFYNSTLVTRGKLDFNRNWGRRALEDSWRRSNKTSFLEDEDLIDLNYDDEDEDEVDELVDSIVEPEVNVAQELRAYYNNIPNSPEQMKVSNGTIEVSLYNLLTLYEDDIQNYELAFSTYEELERRFPEYENMAGAAYRIYKMHLSNEDFEKAEAMKQQIIERHAGSNVADILQDKRKEDTHDDEEQLYRETYTAFLAGDVASVARNTNLMKEKYPTTELYPKFIFLEALSVRKEEGKDSLKAALSVLVDKYPYSEITPLARNMIALIGQGRNVQQQSTTGFASLQQQRTQIVTQAQFEESIKAAGFEYIPEGNHSFVIVIEGDEQVKNKVLFAIASYNFSRFMIKDFDLSVRKLQSDLYAIVVGGLKHLDESVWYQNNIMSNADFKLALAGLTYQEFSISDANYGLIYDRESAEKYIRFYRANQLKVDESDKIKSIEQEAGFVK